jgi:hypothetical protein
MTRGEEMIGGFDAALAALDRLRLEHYEETDVRTILEQLGSKSERFFKSAIFPGSTGADTFDGLINRLKSTGVGKTERQQLHALRELYNDAKHDPTRPMRLKAASEVVIKARAVMQTLIGAKLGATTVPVETVVSRLLWVSAYDDYLHGLTDVYVSLPLPEDVFATHLDVVYVRGMAWDALKAELLATGSLYYGGEHFTPEVYARFNEDDFLNAGVWDGDYRQLIQILSKYEDRPTASEMIPYLRRDHMFVAVLSAIALAGVDVGRATGAPTSIDDLEAAILDRADKAYAMPGEKPWVSTAARNLAELMIQLPFEAWAQLTGPFWNLWNPKPLTAAISPNNDARYVIDDANRVVIV